MRSLRARLGLAFAIGAFATTLISAGLIAIVRWQEEQTRIGESVSLASFELAEGRSLIEPNLDDVLGVNRFALFFDAEGRLISRTGAVSDGLRTVIVADIFAQVVEFDLAITGVYEPDDELIPLVLDTLDAGFDADEEAGIFVDDEERIEIEEDLELELAHLPENFTDGHTIAVSGARCSDLLLCDTVVVGASEESRRSYLARHWWALIGPPLLVAALALWASRWLVAKALRPVDDMRAQLDSITGSDLAKRVPVPETGDELEQLGSSMNRSITRLQSAVSANERFVADAAHELRSPITGVRAALEVEASRSNSGLLHDSLGELDRAARLIDDLLVIARRQGQVSERNQVDLDDVVRSEVATARARFPELSITSSLEPVRLVANGDDLRRVVTNLLENACRYGNGRVEISLQPADVDPGGGRPKGLQLRIDDNGDGIAPAERDRVFDRFARLDDSRSRSTGGSGLGLAIASEIVADHEGTITVADAELGGARFEVWLPNL